MRELTIAVVGGGMFFDEVIGASLKDFERGGLAGALTSIGMSHVAPDVADIRCRFTGIGTHNPASGTAERIVTWFKEDFPESTLRAHYSGTVWEEILSEHEPDVLVVATPDHLHTAPILAALRQGTHVIAEKPVCLKTRELDEIVSLADSTQRIVAVDLHKRYDPYVREMLSQAKATYGQINRVRACLEEPLDVSTEIFQWAEHSNPFAYVGCHWLDVVAHYLDVFPASLHAVGQKNLLWNWGENHKRVAKRENRSPETFSKRRDIHAWDSMSVGVTYTDGMYGDYHNNWINPRDFEGAVNQEIELYGTLGRGMVDQQERGFREAVTGRGSRTRNPIFSGRIKTRASHEEVFGYGKASLLAGMLAAARVKFCGETPATLARTYPGVHSQRGVTMIVEAAGEVAERNHRYLNENRGCPVTARFEEDRIAIVDPYTAPAEEILYKRASA